jgi:zinc protease
MPIAGSSPPSLPEISFTRERLPNGLTVIYHQDHRLPLVTVNTWYHVGSKDESPGRSGFAHLFEHLLFMGTPRVPTGVFDQIIEGAGGSNNASTSQDRTNYYDSGPANLLETLLYLEADRMEGFGRGIDQEKLDIQRRVVQNERRQSYENRPYGKAALERDKLMYPPGHPYHEPVIGSHEDLERATVKDVQEFFARFYVPSNASLVVAGDFELEEARALVKKYYGKIPERGAPPHATPIPVALTEEKRVTIPDRVQLPRVSFIYHSPPIYADGDADLDIASAVLGDGKSSRLYRALVYERKIAQDVAAVQSSETLGSLFEVVATARPGQDLDELEKAMDEVIGKFLAEPVSPVEIERARNIYETQFWHRIEPIGGRADLLNNYQFHFGDPGGIARDLGRYAKVTPPSVQKWAGEVLKAKARLVMRVVPEKKGAAAPARAASDPPPVAPPAAAGPEGAKGPAGAGLGESAPEEVFPPRPPAVGPPPRFQPPVPAVLRLDCGVPLWVIESKQAPIVSLDLLVVGAGAASDPAGRNGLASLTAAMLDEGAGSRGALEISDAIDILGATLVPSVSRERGDLRLTVLERNLDRALDLFADILLRPRFEAKEWERVKALALNELLQRRDNPTAVARVVTDRAFFGDGHPYAAPVAGYADTVKPLELDDLRRFFAERWRPENAVLVAAGSIAPEELKRKLDQRLLDWKGRGASGLAVPPALKTGKGARLFVVEKPGAPQTVISIDMPGLAVTDPGYTALQLANTVFGGSFTSRLNTNLREKHEFTYGARSDFQRMRGQGAFILSTSVKTDVTGEALVEVLRECRGMERGLEQDEFEKAASTVKIDFIEALSTVAGTAETLAAPAGAGLPPDTLRRRYQEVSVIAKSDVDRMAREVFHWDRATVTLVGDRAEILKEIEEARGLIKKDPALEEKLEGPALPDPVFLDAEGRPLESRKSEGGSRK